MNDAAVADTSPPPSPPRVWLLTGHKAGDNTQVVALAEALGWPFELKRFAYQPWELLSNRLLGATLAGVDRTASSALEAPWPDLVITAGRRNEPVARWVRRASGGHTRLVHVGRPWAPLECFDLIVVTPQYFLPERPNVLSIDLPLHRITRTRLEETAACWGDRFADLARPYWSVLLGGNSGPFVFTEAKAVRLACWLNDRVHETGGSLLVTNSARTPDAAFRAFLHTLEAPMSVFRWGDPTMENPYLAYLALADRLVVTGEGAPGPCRPWWSYRHNLRYKPITHHLAMALAPRRLRRDVSRIQQRLVESGRAAWVGETWTGGGGLPDSDLERAAARVRALFAEETKRGTEPIFS